MDNISDGFGNERRFEFLFNSRVIGFVKLSDLVGDPDNKREGPLKKKDNGGHLSQDIGSFIVKGSGFV